MSATSAPFGLRPAFHPSGLDRAQALANGIPSAFNTDIFKGQPVRYQTTAIGGTLGTITPATTSGAWSGAFAGVQWTDTTGRARVSNYWPANTAYTTGSCVAYFYNDQNIVYEIQASGSIAQTAIGNEYNFNNVTSGSTTTGLSAATLDHSSAVGNGSQGQMRIVDLAPYVDNAWGDAYTIVRVVNSQSQFFGSVTAIA
jgi:hypothetical protein